MEEALKQIEFYKLKFQEEQRKASLIQKTNEQLRKQIDKYTIPPRKLSGDDRFKSIPVGPRHELFYEPRIEQWDQNLAFNQNQSPQFNVQKFNVQQPPTALPLQQVDQPVKQKVQKEEVKQNTSEIRQILRKALQENNVDELKKALQQAQLAGMKEEAKHAFKRLQELELKMYINTKN